MNISKFTQNRCRLYRTWTAYDFGNQEIEQEHLFKTASCNQEIEKGASVV